MGSKKIKIISPSGVIDSGWIESAVLTLEEWGCEVSVGMFAHERYGRFAGTDEQRLSDLQDALDDEMLDGILCSRGGYGLIRIVDKLNFDKFRRFPKLIFGFSDITILHFAIQNLNLPSVHSFMSKHFNVAQSDENSLRFLKEIIADKMPVYEISGDCHNKPGYASGMLLGGNLSVIQSLRGTPYEPDYTRKILFIEEISEEAYHIDRMLQNLRIGGVLSKISGLIVGHFTDCTEDILMKKSIKELIIDACSEYDFPVCFGFPAGHETVNYPLIFGKCMKLEICKTGSRIAFS